MRKRRGERNVMEAIREKNKAGFEDSAARGGRNYDALTITREDPAFGNFLWFVARRRIQEEVGDYEALAGIAISQKVKDFFHQMADLKNREAEKLEEYAQSGRFRAEGEDGFPRSLSQRGRGERVVISSMKEACRLALKFEVTNYCLHMHLAELEEHDATKRLFLYLVQIQKANLQFIENKLPEGTKAR